MPDITFLHQDGREITIKAAENSTIMETAVANGIQEIEGRCGGCISCATCHIYIHPDWESRVEAQDNEKSDEEEDFLETERYITENSRLGCQIILTKALDGLIVALPGAHLHW